MPQGQQDWRRAGGGGGGVARGTPPGAAGRGAPTPPELHRPQGEIAYARQPNQLHVALYTDDRDSSPTGSIPPDGEPRPNPVESMCVLASACQCRRCCAVDVVLVLHDISSLSLSLILILRAGSLLTQGLVSQNKSKCWGSEMVIGYVCARVVARRAGSIGRTCITPRDSPLESTHGQGLTARSE